ncbi:MAG TPA: hypothetical protein VKQ34_02360 [Candidatus Saccharimonadales bacterium]|nr:hypothetical protein [Candidatus Saccharimonadales bacterium]
MNKRHLHHVWTRIRPIKTWYLFASCLVLAGICVLSLRSNYVTMTHLRNAVYTADQQDGDVEKALERLRAYVGSHMNTSLATNDGVYPPIQLKYTYARLQQAEQKRVDNINSQVYTSAQQYCEALYPNSFSGGPRVPCIESYVQTHGTAARKIPDAMYKFDFASPAWSPDLAGWTMAAAIVLLVLTVIRFVIGFALEALTR